MYFLMHGGIIVKSVLDRTLPTNYLYSISILPELKIALKVDKPQTQTQLDTLAATPLIELEISNGSHRDPGPLHNC